ncbi:hypothetical protein I8748_21325 [Nostoc sp. CENA67]|uniref:Uncharacterized protein n=1 Tax=Amazonocrinis nigriterrae CENA67 TaxID=2794033 RepID=A0A8J7L8P9_9NOST|nr:hypothetical protein [Amazonocrinis nigriterrae]MBH8564694.1 hypothetical protein [Amazonocrinis nigriterrae CENA67]
MADLETLVNELPILCQKLNLTIGNSHDLMQQVIIISNVQEQLRNIQKLIAQELKVTKNNTNGISTLNRIVSRATLLNSTVDISSTDITNRAILISKKIANSGKEISLIDLQFQISCWLEWGDFLQAIVADILIDSQIVKQLNSNINYPSLSEKNQEFEEILGIKLVPGNATTLKQQVSTKNNLQEDILQVKQKLDDIISTLNSSQNFLTILLAISSFFGKSGFVLEWLDDDHELMISSNSQFQELTEIINDCELFQEKINTILNSNFFRKQSEPVVKHLDQKNETKHRNNSTRVLPNFIEEKIQKQFKLGRLTLVIASSLAVLGLGGWISKDKFLDLQHKSQNVNQEKSAVTNFKSALQLGLEASALVQTPPHPLIVWQQAETKWQEAISLLANIPEGTSVFTQAQNKLTRYRFNYTAINRKVLNEKKAVTDLQLAKKLATEATFFVQNSPHSSLIWQQALDKWQQAITLLEAIPESSFVSQQAKDTLPSYKTNYAAIRTIIND